MSNEILKSKVIEWLQSNPIRKLITDEFKRLYHEQGNEVSSSELAEIFGMVLAEELCISEMVKVDPKDLDETDRGISSQNYSFLYQKILNNVRLHFIGNSLQMLKALGSSIAMRDTGNADHNYRVTIYSVRFAETLGLSDVSIRALIKGSFLHDIGKISIPDNTLLKTGDLTVPEMDEMRNHVDYGAQIVNDVKWLDDAGDIILYHHERWDGTGYLAGLQGENIPLLARIFSVADVFDALTSERPYKNPMPHGEAIDLIERERGLHFDPGILDNFVDISRDLLTETADYNRPELDQYLDNLMDHYFGVNPDDVELRSRYNR